MEDVRVIKKLIREALDDKKYKALINLEYSSEYGIEEMLDQLRAVCGVTIINSEETNKINELKNRVLLKVKFYLAGDSLNEHLSKMISKALTLDGVFSFRVRKVKRDIKKQ